MDRPIRKLSALALCAAIVLSTPGFLWAQSNSRYAQIRGVLLDWNGMPAGGYQLSLRTVDGDLFLSQSTGEDGSFAIENLPADGYEVVATSPDGTEYPIDSGPITVSVGQVARLELRLVKDGNAPGRAPSATPRATPKSSAGGSYWARNKVWIIVAGAAGLAGGILLADDDDDEPITSPITD